MTVFDRIVTTAPISAAQATAPGEAVVLDESGKIPDSMVNVGTADSTPDWEVYTGMVRDIQEATAFHSTQYWFIRDVAVEYFAPSVDATREIYTNGSSSTVATGQSRYGFDVLLKYTNPCSYNNIIIETGCSRISTSGDRLTVTVAQLGTINGNPEVTYSNTTLTERVTDATSEIEYGQFRIWVR